MECRLHLPLRSLLLAHFIRYHYDNYIRLNYKPFKSYISKALFTIYIHINITLIMFILNITISRIVRDFNNKTMSSLILNESNKIKKK